MKRGLPLSLRILLWALLNLVLLGAVGWILFRGQFGLGLDALLAGRAGDRLQSMADVLGGELARTPQTKWDAVLARNATAYELKLMVVRPDGQRWAGEPLEIPPDVRQRLGERPPGDRPAVRPRGVGPRTTGTGGTQPVPVRPTWRRGGASMRRWRGPLIVSVVYLALWLGLDAIASVFQISRPCPARFVSPPV